MSALKAHFDNCKDVIETEQGTVLLPVFKDDTRLISFVDDFSGSTPVCPDPNRSGSGMNDLAGNGGRSEMIVCS